MRKYLFAATAALIVGTPALAQTGPYVGIEGGFLFPRSTTVDATVVDSAGNVGSVNDAGRIQYKNGYDIDAIAGYKFGLFRLEGELGYKHARLKSFEPSTNLINLYDTATGTTLTASDFDLTGHTSVLSGMVNGLVDFNLGNSVGVYAGGGFGRAHVKFSGDGGSDSRNAWAWQLLAGVYVPVSHNLDVGLKYRYFQTGRLNYGYSADYAGTTYDATLSGKFRSHSLLASLTYNFGGEAAAPPPPPPPPPPPAPPPAPATQTCPDGSVIDATATCPVPPPPPPPPAPAARGERGR